MFQNRTLLATLAQVLILLCTFLVLGGNEVIAGKKFPLKKYFYDEDVIRYIKGLKKHGCPERPADDSHLVLINHQGERDGSTPLMWAAANRNIELYKCLLELGADPNIRSNIGSSLIDFVAIFPDPRYLLGALEHGGDPNVVCDREKTPIFSSIAFERKENILILIQHGADLEVRDDNGITPVLSAAIGGDWRIVLPNLEAGANPDVVSRVGLNLREILAKDDRGDNSTSAEAKIEVEKFLAALDAKAGSK